MTEQAGTPAPAPAPKPPAGGTTDAAVLGFRPGETPTPAPGAGDAAASAENSRYIDTSDGRLEVPDQFWDKESGAVNVAALLKSQTDLRKQISQTPKAPESYELKVPEPLAGKVEIAADDPFAKKAMEWAKARNLPQDAFDELAALYLEQQAGTWDADSQAVVQEIEADVARLTATLGKDAPVKIAQLDQWLSVMATGADNKPDAGMINAIKNLRITADGTLFLMHLRDKMGNPAIPGATGTAPAGGALTREQLREMKDDPRYWKSKDKDFIAKVDAGYQKLFSE